MKAKIAVYVALILSVLAVYGQALDFEFVGSDDPFYVTKNDAVQQGLTLENLAWAFHNTASANWHPVTWLSHMLDVELFGLNAGGHHATSVLLHLVNSMLLFGLFSSLTGRVAPAAFVAFVFALHPLHVESVAWVAERKDVLSTFFWLLACFAYARYGRSGTRASYWACFLLLALGLASKSMVVTLPFVFLLLDVWPLGRWTLAGGRGAADPALARRRPGPVALVVEKLPFFALSAAVSVLTVIYQRFGGAFRLHDALSWQERFSNAAVSYVRYLAKTAWPDNLHLFYAHPGLEGGTPWSPLEIAGSLLLLAAVTAACIAWRSRPYLLVGWLWFVGTLVPVIGLVQVGAQAIADRYMYVPMVGLLIMLGFGVSDLLARPFRLATVVRPLVVALAAAAILALGVASWAQAQHWRDSEALYRHALETSEDDHFRHLLHVMYGTHIAEQGRVAEAALEFRASTELNPEFAAGWRLLGRAMMQLGNFVAAEDAFARVIGLEPDDARAHEMLGLACVAQGENECALEAFERAIELDPNLADARWRLVRAYLDLGREEDAMRQLEALIEADPAQRDAYEWLASIHESRGETESAQSVREGMPRE